MPKSDYEVSYPLSDSGDPPEDKREIVSEIMREGLFHPGDFESWTWERKLFAESSTWILSTFPVVDSTRPSVSLQMEAAVNGETDPEKALVLAWRYRGRKKETMRLFEQLSTEGRAL